MKGPPILVVDDYDTLGVTMVLRDYHMLTTY